jgi:oligopeptidase B
MLCSGFSFAQEEYKPPVVKKIPKVDSLHGDTITDNYFWLREKYNPDVINYLYAENAYSDNIMKHTRLLQKRLFEELKGLYAETRDNLPYKRDDYYYYTRNEKGKDYPIFCRKKNSLDSPEEIYFDANEAAKEYGFFSLGIFSISPDHNMLAYGIDNTGGRVNTLFIKNLTTGELLKDSLPKLISICWAADNQTIFYVTPEAKTIRGNKIFRHKLGTHTSNDVLIFEEPDPTFQLGISMSISKKYLLLGSQEKNSNEIWYLESDNPEGKFKLFQRREKNLTYAAEHFDGDEFYIQTNLNAINFRIMKTAVLKTGKEYWTEAYPHREDVLLRDFHLFKDFIIISEKENATDQLRVINRTNGSERMITFPEEFYSASYSAGNFKYVENKMRISYTSLITPEQVFEYDLVSDERVMIYEDTLQRDYDKNLYQQERIYATAPDGTKIPVSIVYRKDLEKNGKAPVLLTGYGSYGASSDISFSPQFLSFLDRGFVYAVAHIRGSDDLGRKWYDDGKMLKKKNTFTDFIACAEVLIEQGFTSPEKLVIRGGSAGGLLVGTAVNMRPDLFKCVIAHVPFVDVINTMLDASLPLTTFEYEEWGNPQNQEYYNYIKTYSPYENVKAQDYPVMLVTAGYNDSQVAYWEPAKWVAKLRETKTDTNLLLFRTSMEGGHSRTSGRYSGLKDLAYEMAFIMQTLGIRENYIGVNGKVVDGFGEAMPYVTVYVNGTTNGTTTNFNGDFYLEIKDGQKSEIVFQSVGFKKLILPVDMNTPVSDLKVKMQAESIQLKQFTVSAKAKDPAYNVIKNAIAKRDYYYKLANSYSADIYIKGTTRLDEIPEKLPFFISVENMPDSNDLGLVYLSESVARYHFQLPDNYKEEMISSKVAGTNRGFSWNRVEDVLYNFNKNRIALSYYADREFISPIADGAMVFYKYKTDGTFFEDGKLVNKIQVIPRNNADPVFHGYIYIFEDTWNIHSLDLFITKEAQLMFVDTLHINQSFAPVNDSLWMPIQLKISSQIKIFGFGAAELYIGFFSNYQMNKNFPKKFFHNEVFRVETEANKKDSAYWKDTRPVLLTQEEQKHYFKKDSISEIQNSKEYLDSLDAKQNKITVGKILLNGYSHRNRFKKRNYYIYPLITTASYNTVEGAVINFSANFNQQLEKGGLSISPTLRYGLASQQLYGSLKSTRTFNRLNFSSLSFEGGIMPHQFNHNEPISPFVNTLYTLLGEQNYMKIYERWYSQVSYKREIINGLTLSGSAEYNHRKPLFNNSDFALLRWPNRQFTSNDPLNPFSEATGFAAHNALIFEVGAKILFKQKYESYPEYKRIIGSKYPSLNIKYRKGIATPFSDVNFDYVEISSSHEINWGYWGNGSAYVAAGTFLNSAAMSVVDYRHFNGNQTIFLKNGYRIGNFNNLPYYAYSTNTGFAELHYEHRFKGLFLGKFPLIKKLGIWEVAGANAIYTLDRRDYQEVYVGADNIAKIFRVDFVASYVAGQRLVPQVRIGVKAGF